MLLNKRITVQSHTHTHIHNFRQVKESIRVLKIFAPILRVPCSFISLNVAACWTVVFWGLSSYPKPSNGISNIVSTLLPSSVSLSRWTFFFLNRTNSPQLHRACVKNKRQKKMLYHFMSGVYIALRNLLKCPFWWVNECAVRPSVYIVVCRDGCTSDPIEILTARQNITLQLNFLSPDFRNSF